MKDDLAYTPTTCFEPFPFPQDWTSDLSVESGGKSYDEFRAVLMVKSMEGLIARAARRYGSRNT
jgi:hypothetical protein